MNNVVVIGVTGQIGAATNEDNSNVDLSSFVSYNALQTLTNKKDK